LAAIAGPAAIGAGARAHARGAGCGAARGGVGPYNTFGARPGLALAIAATAVP
jgi:hypothetical protein